MKPGGIHFGDGWARRHRVHGDAACAQGHCQRAAQGVDGALGHGVHQFLENGNAGIGGGGEINDTPTLTQQGQSALDEEKRGTHIHAEDVVELLWGRPLDGASTHRCIVDQDVQPCFSRELAQPRLKGGKERVQIALHPSPARMGNARPPACSIVRTTSCALGMRRYRNESAPSGYWWSFCWT